MKCLIAFSALAITVTAAISGSQMGLSFPIALSATSVASELTPLAGPFYLPTGVPLPGRIDRAELAGSIGEDRRGLAVPVDAVRWRHQLFPPSWNSSEIADVRRADVVGEPSEDDLKTRGGRRLRKDRDTVRGEDDA